MAHKKNTRINTLFSESIHRWLAEEADICNVSLAAMVRDKVALAREKDAILKRIDRLEKVIKKSHAILAEKVGQR